AIITDNSNEQRQQHRQKQNDLLKITCFHFFLPVLENVFPVQQISSCYQQQGGYSQHIMQEIDHVQQPNLGKYPIQQYETLCRHQPCRPPELSKYCSCRSYAAHTIKIK